MGEGVSFPYLDPQLEPWPVRGTACPSCSPFVWVGWNVLKLFVVGSSLQAAAFMNLLRQPVSQKGCLLPVLCTSQLHAQSLWSLSVFCSQARWELLPVCEKWIAFVGGVRVPNSCILMCSRCSSMIPCELLQCNKVWTLVAHPHPEGGVASSWKMPSCPCGFGLVWLGLVWLFTFGVLLTGVWGWCFICYLALGWSLLLPSEALQALPRTRFVKLQWCTNPWRSCKACSETSDTVVPCPVLPLWVRTRLFSYFYATCILTSHFLLFLALLG